MRWKYPNKENREIKFWVHWVQSMMDFLKKRIIVINGHGSLNHTFLIYLFIIPPLRLPCVVPLSPDTHTHPFRSL